MSNVQQVKMIACTACTEGMTASGVCQRCGGVGRVAQRRKPVLTSTSRGQTFFRGALVSQNYKLKGTKR